MTSWRTTRRSWYPSRLKDGAPVVNEFFNSRMPVFNIHAIKNITGRMVFWCRNGFFIQRYGTHNNRPPIIDATNPIIQNNLSSKLARGVSVAVKKEYLWCKKYSVAICQLHGCLAFIVYAKGIMAVKPTSYTPIERWGNSRKSVKNACHTIT